MDSEHRREFLSAVPIDVLNTLLQAMHIPTILHSEFVLSYPARMRSAHLRLRFDKGDLAFIILAGALVLFMVPGLAFLYSGLSRRKSSLHMIWAVAAANAVGVFQWYFWGYSLAFSPTATNGFIGNLHNFALRNVGGLPSAATPLLPELLYAFFQMEFACVTVGILMGALAERGRVLPAMLFAFFWMTLVYAPVACWVWNPSGWAFKWGVLDFAGGGPVEIASGMGGLAYSWALGRRQEKELLNFRPHHVALVVLGTFMLWVNRERSAALALTFCSSDGSGSTAGALSARICAR